MLNKTNLSKVYLGICGVALLGFIALASCEAEARPFPKWAQPEQSLPVQLGNFDESPQLFDWQLLLFFHRKTPGPDSKVQRFIRAYNRDTKEECEAGRLTVLAIDTDDFNPIDNDVHFEALLDFLLVTNFSLALLLCVFHFVRLNFL